MKQAPIVTEQLQTLLQQTFRLPAFRPFQEIVCQTVLQGQDVLLVMPTGAGKSLCFQLPGLARAGMTLVISPLIALMEDQVAKLQALGIRAERIHSGRDRLTSRQVCRDYLQGALDFLFIAPERLSVPGFPEMLAKRKPTLIAVDEAHCISHWGHDFRPEYRMLGQHLPPLRPAPIIALTATATPLVQEDIIRQLAMPAAVRCIHGFRRTNIAVEVIEMKPAARPATVQRILADPARRPAIVYAPTRKDTENLGALLRAEFPAAAYHAGMSAAERERIQMAFGTGELEVIVATIAFGMGVDKPNIRTVIHTALPGTLEGYYQEIGRAGRDGELSRAILLYSYADRRTHEYFFERDYPPATVLQQIFQTLNLERQPRESALQQLELEPAAFDIALERLWIHGGAQLDAADNICRGNENWQASYQTQREHRLLQLEQITQFAAAHDCRMLHLVRHFGDQEDSGEACGLCDVCTPEMCVVSQRRAPTTSETQAMLQIFDALAQRNGQTTGQLFKQIERLERRAFEKLLSGLAHAGLIEISEDSFVKDNRPIRFWRVFLTEAGRRGGATASAKVRIADTKPAPGQTMAQRDCAQTESQAPTELIQALKAWRLEEARRRGVPAFRIFSDRTLRAIAAAQPADAESLLAVTGVGPVLVQQYGEQILALIQQQT